MLPESFQICPKGTKSQRIKEKINLFQFNMMVDDILSGDKNRETKVFDYCNKYLRGYARNNKSAPAGMSKKEWENDVLQIAVNEAILALFKNVRSGAFKGESTVQTYLVTIFNRQLMAVERMWKGDEAVNQSMPDGIEHKNESGVSLHETVEFQNIIDKLVDLFNRVGNRCWDLFYEHFKGFPDKILAELLGYNNDAVVAQSRSVCLRELRRLALRELPEVEGFMNV